MDHHVILRQKYSPSRFDNINEFILAVIPTNKAELVKVNGYGAIAFNDEAKTNLHYLLYV